MDEITVVVLVCGGWLLLAGIGSTLFGLLMHAWIGGQDKDNLPESPERDRDIPNPFTTNPIGK